MDVNAEIVRMKRSGYSPVDIYIYVKDYVTSDQFAHLYEAL
jgi:hypothetical protein